MVGRLCVADHVRVEVVVVDVFSLAATGEATTPAPAAKAVNHCRGLVIAYFKRERSSKTYKVLEVHFCWSSCVVGMRSWDSISSSEIQIWKAALVKLCLVVQGY